MMTQNPQNTGSLTLQLTSPVFREGGVIPPQYTCKSKSNVNPPLNIAGVPDAAKSLVLIVHDPDAVGTDYLHWMMWDISPKIETIGANSVPAGAIQGINSAGTNSYVGPCPPVGSGTHRYIFELYALDTILGMNNENYTWRGLKEIMKTHILDQHRLTGLVAASS